MRYDYRVQIELPKKRHFDKTSVYAKYEQGFNHALGVCKQMLIEQGFEIIEIDEREG